MRCLLRSSPSLSRAQAPARFWIGTSPSHPDTQHRPLECRPAVARKAISPPTPLAALHAARTRSPMADPNAASTKDCLSQAVVDGGIAGVKALVIAGALYGLAWRYSPFFRYTFSASSRTALTVMPVFYTSYLNVEYSMKACMQTHQPLYVRITDDDEE